VWWLVSTLAGGLAFETPEQPGLAVIIVACATLAIGGFTAFIWPMGLSAYAYGLPQMLMRAQHQAHVYLSQVDTRPEPVFSKLHTAKADADTRTIR
jgi:predicted phage tail protein